MSELMDVEVSPCKNSNMSPLVSARGASGEYKVPQIDTLPDFFHLNYGEFSHHEGSKQGAVELP